MNKEEARLKFNEVQDDLIMAEVVLKMHKSSIKNMREEIAELEAIINKKDDWRDKLPRPEKEGYAFISNNTLKGLIADKVSKNSGCLRKPEHSFRTADQAELVKDKMLLMQEMYAFAYARNEGWVPDWKDENRKWGLITDAVEGIYLYSFFYVNPFIFGITVKSEEIAQEMLEEFGERIEKIYGKQY